MAGSESDEGDDAMAPKISSVIDLEVVPVTSEVHIGCPSRFSGYYASQFTFSEPYTRKQRYEGLIDGEAALLHRLPMVDDDGDLDLPRDRKPSLIYQVTIKHLIKSSIPSVGLQVWKGALILADFILHTMFTSSDFNDIIALELGAGTGIVGILLARAARTVFLTDYDNDVLDNCKTNVDTNSGLFGHCLNSVCVRKLDWKESWPPTHVTEDMDFPSLHRSLYSWTSSEIKEAENASLLVAADVIYVDELTNAFFNTIDRLMSCGVKKVLYIALEKRYNFSMDDLDVVANGYSCFLSHLRDGGECRGLDQSTKCFVGNRVDMEQIPQYIQEYDRGRDLEIWRIERLSVV